MTRLPVQRPLLALALSLLGLALTPAAASAQELAGDLKALQGTWVGAIRTPEPGRTFKLVMVVEGTDFTWTMAIENEGRRNQVKGKVKLDETTEPRQLDLVDVQVNGQAEKPMLTVYVLEADGQTLRIGLPESPVAPRPTAMPVDPDRGPPRVITFKREAPKPDAPADAKPAR